MELYKLFSTNRTQDIFFFFFENESVEVWINSCISTTLKELTNAYAVIEAGLKRVHMYNCTST